MGGVVSMNFVVWHLLSCFDYSHSDYLIADVRCGVPGVLTTEVDTAKALYLVPESLDIGVWPEADFDVYLFLQEHHLLRFAPHKYDCTTEVNTISLGIS